ncbi:MAG TPA: succinate dehydrogenase cytochrome b558 subunit [Phycisphaerae bacterium]|nr:succinate dehydrogenase cytochrome b558 subunit [Phycisphaerales bacterium]HRX86138.1 succinate dehydrogenase cytochrome b558 subunit [Phycisphaerae bacterium]
MAGTITSAESAKEKYFFLLRRLHSLSGLVPVGVFLLWHLIVNATVLAGGDKFQFMVDQIHQLQKAGLLFVVEMAFIFLPLAFHAVYGVVIALSADMNAREYRYGPNIRYTLQRWTGIIAFAFIMFHVWQMHWLGEPFGGSMFKPHDAPASTAAAIQASWWFITFYIVGVTASVYHLSNGIWTALITWGITIGQRAQRISGYFCTAFGVALLLVGMGALWGFTTYHAPAQPDQETAHTAAFVADPQHDSH